MKIKRNSVFDSKLKTIWQIDLYFTFCVILILVLIKEEMPWILKQIGLMSFYHVFVQVSNSVFCLSLFVLVTAINVCLLLYTFMNVIRTIRVKN